MTSSMCVSVTDRPSFAQRQNEQRRQSYGYYQTAKKIKTGFARELAAAMQNGGNGK